MPHKRLNWARWIKGTQREYQAVRIGVDWLLGAQPDELHDLTDERGWDEMAVADLNVADHNLEATYLIRMYTVYERAILSYWRSWPGNTVGAVDGDVLLNEVGIERRILDDVIRDAQAVRTHRNNLVHRRIEDHAKLMTLDSAKSDVLYYLEKLPEEWS